MANINATIRAKIETPSTPTLYNLECAVADTEYEQTLNANTKQLMVRARNGAEIKFSFQSALSTPEYLTIARGSSLAIDAVNYTGSIFLRCSKADTVVEIMEWV